MENELNGQTDQTLTPKQKALTDTMIKEMFSKTFPLVDTPANADMLKAYMEGFRKAETLFMKAYALLNYRKAEQIKNGSKIVTRNSPGF